MSSASAYRGGNNEVEISVRAKQEVHDLHSWFVEYFNGKPNKDDTFDVQFVPRFHPSFAMVTPDGSTGMKFVSLIEAMKGLYNCNPSISIQCRNVETLHVGPNNCIVIVRYEEWQKNSLNQSKPNNARISTAAFVPEPNAPNGVQWVTLQETWLPDSVLLPENFNF